MNSASWLTPEAVQTLGWTLVHFVWEGAAVALLLYVFFAFTRNARVRYAAAVAALALMVGLPAGTFAFLQNRPELTADTGSAHQVITSLQVAAKLAIDNSGGALRTPVPSIDWLSYLVWAWFGGVLLFALRALGGWFLLERLHREKSEPLDVALRNRCAQLQEQLGLARTVRYFQSRIVDAPAVMGWFRPVVLIPVTALTGLSPEQLEAVIVHELAHIKRLDCFVNLFQIAAETVLFYHPAVWWVSKAVRTERENCCDDIAVSVCGNPGGYARALAIMEGWRAAPALVLAANNGSLRSRVSRLLGAETITRSIPRGGLAAVGLLCAAGALFATTTVNGIFGPITDSSGAEFAALPSPPPAPPVPAIAEAFTANCSRFVRVTRIEDAAPAVLVAVNGTSALAAPPAIAQASQAASSQAAASQATSSQAAASQAAARQAVSGNESGSKASYIAGLQAAGLKDLTVDQLIALKVQGVTAEYVREMHGAGLDTSINNLIAMKVQGITPEYLKDIRANGLNPDTHDLIAMKVQGITPEYVKEVRATGLNPDTRDLVAMKVQGVTPEYIRGLQAAGFKDLKTSDVIAAKVQGVTPEFVQQVRSHGFNNLTIHQLIRLKIAGIL